MEKATGLSDYIYNFTASGFIFGCTFAQSAQCSCVAGGIDEVAGWRWGFPALAWALTLAQKSVKALLGQVCLSTCHTAGFPPLLPFEL